MKIPALKARIGNWDYYIASLTFQQVNDFVSRIDERLHKSETLKDLIQRSITNNFLSIKDYILNQPEVFFNSLVLAVYDDYPIWREIEFTYDDGESYQMGLLEFPGEHKIFPIDGQHRVEGIKAALDANPDLKDQRIAAIFVGHKNDDAGKQRTRRLFTTLNRYAKPVSLDDIIALDEDDSVAIVTRYLLEEYDLFTGKRIVIAKQKAIPTNNKEAMTSIITLYQSNTELLKSFYENIHGKKATKKILEDYLKFRRSNEELEGYLEYCKTFWNAFKTKLSFVVTYLATLNRPTEAYRNNETGGNLVFRPIGFLPLVKAALYIQKKSEADFETIFENFDAVNFNLNSKPWISVAWNQIEAKMIMNSDGLIQTMLVYLYDSQLLTPRELQKLKEGYAARISYEEEVDNVLDTIDEE